MPIRLNIPITKSVRQKIGKIAVKYDLKLVILYGSHAQGRATRDSDIDIAVLGNNILSFKTIIDLINDFTDIFKSNNVDVKSLHNVDPLFRYEATAKGVLIFGSEYDFASFRAYAFRDYMDSESLFKLKEVLIKKRLGILK